jgi:hypothetical protein
MGTIFDKNYLDKLSSAERHKLADGLAAAAETMDVEQKRILIEALSSALDKNVKAQATTDRRKAFIAKLSAMRADQHVGAGNALKLIEGTLARAHCPPLEDLGAKPLHGISSILAASKLSVNDRMAVKGMLHRLGAID